MDTVTASTSDHIGGARLARRAGAWAAAIARHGAVGATESLRRRATRNGTQDSVARVRLSRMLVDLGPTFIKGGQLLSTRQDILPPQLCTALSQLYDRVPPMTRAQVEMGLSRAYPAPAEWPFRAFDWVPAASGSIACVYRATLRDGRDVAVKVRRPEIRERMRADFTLLGKGARVMQLLPGMRKVPARRIVEQLGFAILGQLDLQAEAAALAKLRANLGELPQLRIPAPFPEFGRDGVLVMEHINGLDRFAPGEMNREQRREVVRRVLHGVFQMLFLDGLVHCDMHPGNLYLTRDGEIVLLDAGFVVQLSPSVKRLFAEFFLDMSMGRGDDCADVVLRSSDEVPADADLDAFRAGIRELVETAYRQTAGQFRLAPFATRLFDLQRRSGIAAAPEFVFPLLSLLVLEGMINAFDVDVDFQGEAIPTLLTALRT